ncbi:MAG: hypothetical protein ACRDK4_12195, partial [Solirubrobacteraceae bacterium]
AAAGSATAAAGPAPIDLGALSGGTDSRALGESEDGQVVGWSYTDLGSRTAVHAFSWSRGSGMIDLNSTVSLGGKDTAASEVNDDGQIVGYSFTPDERPNAYSWTQQLGLVDLGTLTGGSESRATRVNGRGQVVGWADTTSVQPGSDSGIRHAFSWTQAGGMVDLGTFGGAASTAAAVNDNGQVIGYSDLASGAWRAFLWTRGGGMLDLGTLGGTTSTAHAISNDGQVAGQSTTAHNGPTHAFSWTLATGMVDLGTLGGSGSVARGVSNNGQVVGYSETAGGATHAFSWTQGGGIVDLGTLPGDSSSYAEAVNDSGQVVGWSVNAAGHSHAVLWRLPTVRISGLRLTPARLRAERRGPTAYLKVKWGAKIEFRLSAAALVTFTLEQALPGRRRGKRCLREPHLPQGLPPCTRDVLRGSFRTAAHAGLDAFPLSVKRLNDARLQAGAYLLSATAAGTDGALANSTRFRFTIKPPQRG